MKKIEKGNYGYLIKKRNRQIMFTVLLFAVSFSLLLGGYLLVKTKMNLLTVVAVLGMLPASKALVETIMYLKAKGTSYQTYEAVRGYEDELLLLYDLYFTSEKENFPISVMIIRNKTICFYMENTKDHCQNATKHIKSIFLQNNFQGYAIKGYDQLDSFLNRAEEMKKIGSADEKIDAFVLETLLNISL